jgi:hypothetical protein
MVSNVGSCQKEYTCKIWKPPTPNNQKLTKVKVLLTDGQSGYYRAPVISGALKI